jgi:putative hydrolase of the HAD superfamily
VIEAVVFDLSGVLFTNGLRRGAERIAPRFGLDRKRLEEVLNGSFSNDYRLGLISPDRFWREAALELGLDGGQIAWVRQVWFSSYELIEETLALVKKVKKAGYRTAYLSDSPAERTAFLEQKYRFEEHFDVGICSFHAQVRKPDRKIFQFLLTKLSTRPGEILYIDDKERNLKPAFALGMKTLLFQSPSRLQIDLARFLSLAENRQVFD